MLVQKTGIDNLISNILSPVSFWNQFRVNLLFIGISFAFWYARRSYQAERDHERLEKEILDAKLMSLKSQINPHFLYNTLSFIYTKALSYSDELAGAIARLSDMMRYSLGEVDVDGKVPLTKEINHMKNFIEIQQMRFSNKLKIDLQIEGDPSQWRVMPLMLITFVENAFKHGKLDDPTLPLLIRLMVAPQVLEFETKNRKATGMCGKNHGIGLRNMRNRLELTYPDHHQFMIDYNNEQFNVYLKLY